MHFFDLDGRQFTSSESAVCTLSSYKITLRQYRMITIAFNININNAEHCASILAQDPFKKDVYSSFTTPHISSHQG